MAKLLVSAAPLAIALWLQLLAAQRPVLVERLYSRKIHPLIGAGLGRVTGLFPFSLAEPLAILAVLLLMVLLVRAGLSLRRGPFWSALLESGATLLAAAGGLYLVFLLLWGLNYHRQPFGQLAALDTRPPTPPELVELGTELVEEANRLRMALPEDSSGVMRLPSGTRETLGRAPLGYDEASRFYASILRSRTRRPKPALLSPVLSSLGISGIYSPFTAEPLVNRELPDPDVPFSAAHELAHDLGFAREDEAHYLGSLACRVHPDADFRYSGALAASVYVVDAVASNDEIQARELHLRRSEAVRRDLQAIREWSERHEGRLSRVSTRVNDAYLRSQGQREGIRSYGRFVDLLVAEQRARGRMLRSGP
jgi:hypothetical protein